MPHNTQTYGFDKDTDPAILDALAHDNYSGHFARHAAAAGWKPPVYKSKQQDTPAKHPEGSPTGQNPAFNIR